MLKKLSLCLALALAALSATAESQALKINRFQQIKVTGPLNVDCVYCPDSVGTIIVNAKVPQQISWVEASNSGDKLKLRLILPDDMRSGAIPVIPDLPSVKVYTNYLTSVENEGDSTVRVLTATDVPTFNARLMGNGRLSVRGISADKLKAVLFAGKGIMVLNGKADQATYSLTGVGTIEADGVTVREAKARLTGTGSVGIHATDKLTITGSGSGTVFLRGTPDIKKKVSLGIKLQPID
ncbi:MAG: DUF2807 domain-containing protein [Muribaculaceae bacterium]|nr:DUF2807 domain-containing protein [Muribaculaceae bacterium]